MEKLSIKMKHAVLFAAMGSLALFAQGCKDDTLGDIGDGNDGNGLAAGTHYLAFNIVSDAGSSTRSSWSDTTPQPPESFDAGDEKEQAITSVEGSNVVLLFNEDSTFHSMVNLNADRVQQGETDDRYGENSHLEKTIGTFTANIKIAEGTKLPKMLLVVLNGNPERLSQLEIELKTGTLHLYDVASNETLRPAEYALAYLTRRLSDEAIGGSNSSIVLFSPNGSDDEYCTMTNSVYVGPGDTEGDKEAGSTGKIYNFTKIEEDKIKSTEEEAANNPLTVHVERLAVKVELNLDEKNLTKEELGVTDRGGFKFPVLIKPADDNKVGQVVNGKDTTVNWAFSMLGWSTNAVARRMYLFKNLDDSRADISGGTDITPHYSNGKIETQFFNGWNDATHARCYWAVDGHYADIRVYPLQYRVAMDGAAKNSYKELSKTVEGKDSSQNMPLYYYSFQQLCMISMGLIPNADPKELTGENYTKFKQPGTLRSNAKYRYCGENVLGQNLINDLGHIWRGAATHVIIFGQLLLGDEIKTYTDAVQGKPFTQELLEEASDKLYAAGSYWSRAGYMQYAFGTIFRALTATSREVTDYFGGSGTIKTPRTNITITYKKNGEEGDGTDLTDYFIKLKEENPDLNLDDIHDNFQFDEDDCNGTDDGSECIFRLSAANVTNGDGKVMLGLKKGYTLTIKGKNENSMKDTTVYITPEKFLSLAYEFAGTANYFALGRMYYYAPIYHNVASVPENGPANVGDIGVVRNNWYKLTISSLLKPGIPVSDPDQPIIPNVDPSDRYLGLDIHILPWHVIKQDITLQ